MNLFYASHIDGDEIHITGQEATHCHKVLRSQEGSTVMLMDGIGGVYEAVIEQIYKDRIVAKVKVQHRHELDKRMPHLAFGIIKHPARLEWLIEKITEVGVSRITPLICTRSEKRNIKKDRIQKIMLSAAKQSKAYHFPTLDDPMTIEEFMSQVKRKGYVASWAPDVPELSSKSNTPDHPVMLIGPEGDFTDDELSTFVNAGYRRVNLGSKRLRAETAAVVACTLLMV